MPSAANAKSEKPASSEVVDNSPVKQIMTLIEHKIRNLEKRKSKLSSYRELQKTGKELNADQKVAVAKYDEVAQTLEFARDLSKHVGTIAVSAEREAKKQAKREAWVRCTADTNKIKEVLLVLDCLMLMGNTEVREDFLNGTNGATKLTEEDLRILDDLYPEVTPKHELNEEGQSAFHASTVKAAEHLYSILDGKPKEVLGTTYAHIKEIVTSVHDSGYFEKTSDAPVPETETVENHVPEEVLASAPPDPTDELEQPAPMYPPHMGIPTAPAPSVVPAPGYPMSRIPPITLQEVEHAYFAQQYPQQRPISEVIGSQNFIFLQESEIDSPVATPQPPMMNQASPPGPIPTQTFTNQHFVQLPPGHIPDGTMMPPQPHFPPHPEHFAGVPMPIPGHPMPQQPHPQAMLAQQHISLQGMPTPVMHPEPVPQNFVEQAPAEERESQTPVEDKNDTEEKESRSPDGEDGDRKTQGQGDGQNRFRRYRGGGRGAPNGYRGRGNFQNRQNNDGYHNRHGEYQNRPKDGYHNRQYNDNYQNRHKDYQSRGNDGYYGNGDTDSHQQAENGRDRYGDSQGYQGFKGRGRGGARGSGRGAARPPRPHFNRKQEHVE